MTVSADVEMVVRSLGVPGNTLRFLIFLRAVALSVVDSNLLDCRGRDLYKILSAEFERSRARISKNIFGYCIALWKDGDRARLDVIAGYHVDTRPKPLDLIGSVSGYILRQRGKHSV